MLHKKNKTDPLDYIRYGKLIKTNNFNTTLGMYTIRIVDYEGYIYFHKMRGGEVVEILKIGKSMMYRREK